MTIDRMSIFSTIQNSSRSVAQWSAVLLALTIPVSVALDNLLLALLLVSGLMAYWLPTWQAVQRHPVARASVALFAVLLIGCAYGTTPLKEAGNILGKYVDLAFIPLLLVIFKDIKLRLRAERLFLLAMIVTLSVSWLVGLHILGKDFCMWDGCEADNPSIFRSRITQNIMMAYTAYLLVLRAREAGSNKARWLFTGLAVLAGGNVLFMVSGKTGYLIVLALLTYFAWITLARRLHIRGRSIGWREGAGIGLLTLALVLGTYQVSPRLHERVDEMVTESQTWQPNIHNKTSTGERQEFYYNTFALVKQHPLLGVGTGGFPAAYAQQVQGKDVTLTRNPHNEYLLVTVQVGVAGLVLLLYLFYTQWRHAAELPGTFEQDAARGLVLTIAITSLFNSPLLDHTEGLFFAFMSALLFANLGSGRRHG